MADSNFVVKNSLTVNTSFMANSSQVSLGTINATSNGIVLTATTVSLGNSSVNVSINATSFSGTANNATNLGGTVASGYQTTAGLSANVATLTSNNATNLGGVPASAYVNTSGNYTLSGNISFTGTITGVSQHGSLIRGPRILTSGTSYTTPANCNAIYIELCGASGGSGYSNNKQFPSGGSASGAYAAKYFSVTPNTAYSYTIGAAGIAGNSTVFATNGGSTTFTANSITVTAGGGGYSNNSDTGFTAIGGTATNGDININGQNGFASQSISSNGSYIFSMSGAGGSSLFGFGGISILSAGFSSSIGNQGVGYGAGSGGAVGGSANGAVGLQGIIRIWEYS